MKKPKDEQEVETPVPARGKSGPKPHDPTPEQRALVEKMTFLGYTQDRIAEIMGFSVDTLQRHYPQEIAQGKHGRLTEVADSLFQSAKKGDTTAAIFILKTQAGWRDKPTQIEVTGADGGPIATEEKSAITSRLMAALAKAKKGDA